MKNDKLNLNWVNIVFLIATPLVAIICTSVLAWRSEIPAATWILGFVYMMVTGLAITAGYHRLFSHRTYETVWPVKLFFLLFGAAAFQNSALKWSADHRDHHKDVDTDNDPYNIKKGFWYAHIGWVFLKEPEGFNRFDRAKDLLRDKLVMWQHRHYMTIGVIVSFILPAAIGSLWGDPFGAFIIAGVLRMVMNHHFTFFINSLYTSFSFSIMSAGTSSVDTYAGADAAI